MLVLTILIFFFTALNSFAETPIGNDWQSGGQLSETRIFQKKEMSVSIFEGTAPEKRLMTASNFKSEILQSSELRKKTLELLGTSNWQINEMSFLENKEKKTVLLRGQFQRDGLSFEFTEWQIYSEKNLIQLQLENQKGDSAAPPEIQYFTRWVQNLK